MRRRPVILVPTSIVLEPSLMDTVKVESFSLIAEDLAVTTTVVKGLDDAKNRHGLASDP